MRFLTALALTACLSGQVEQFEVASVRVRNEPLRNGTLTISGPRITIQGWSVRGLLVLAFGVKDYQIEGFTSLDPTTYDIAAVAADGRARTREEFGPPMQALLQDRFRLRFHRETRDKPVYALVVDRNGPKLQPSSAGKDEVSFEAAGRSIGRTHTRVTIADVAETIRVNLGLDRPVIDRTGIEGFYKVRLLYTPESRRTPAGVEDPTEISVFAAVREQLGLRLEKQTAPIEILVIDRIERAAEN